MLRHTVATLSYRAAKVLRGAPGDFSDFRAGPQSRSAGEILAHMCDLLDWVLSQAKGQERWRPLPPTSWAEDSQRFSRAILALDDFLASNTPAVPPEKMFQGAIADSLTHVGQLAMLRSLAGFPIEFENYSIAPIGLDR
jgi:hypothetical protein